MKKAQLLIKFLKKTYFYFIALLLVVVLLSITLFKKPNNIFVCAYTYPYSIVSSVEDEDYLNVSIYTSEKKSYFSDKTCMVKAYLEDDDNYLSLSLVDLYLDKNNIETIENRKYYKLDYCFKVNMNLKSEYEVMFKDAHLHLDFVNGIESVFNIGSLSYFKYDNKLQDVSINNLRPISTSGGKSGLFGFQMSLRNVSSYPILVKDVITLDVNIKNYKIFVLDGIVSSMDQNEVLSEARCEFDELSLSSDEEVYLLILFNLENYNLNYKLSSLGLKVCYEQLSLEYTYTMEKFLFYKETRTNYKAKDIVINEYTY